MDLNTSTDTTSGVSASTSGDVGSNNAVGDTSTSGGGSNTEKLLREKKNAMEALRVAQEELKKVKDSQLLEKENFKQLYESAKSEAAETKGKLSALQENLKVTKVNTVLTDELIKLGLNASHIATALKLADKNLVQVDTETGVVIGAAEAARAFHTKHADLGFFSKKTIGVNQDATSGNPSLDANEAYKIDLQNAKTQGEFDAVMRKYKKI